MRPQGGDTLVLQRRRASNEANRASYEIKNSMHLEKSPAPANVGGLTGGSDKGRHTAPRCRAWKGQGDYPLSPSSTRDILEKARRGFISTGIPPQYAMYLKQRTLCAGLL